MTPDMEGLSEVLNFEISKTLKTRGKQLSLSIHNGGVTCVKLVCHGSHGGETTQGHRPTLCVANLRLSHTSTESLRCLLDNAEDVQFAITDDSPWHA